MRQRFLDNLRKLGRVGAAARAIGSSEYTISDWRDKDPEFDEQVGEAYAAYVDDIEKEIRRRAIEGVDQVAFMTKDGETIMKRVFSDRLLELHAKRHMPEYRERQTIDMNVAPGAFVVPGLNDTRIWEGDYLDVESESVDEKEGSGASSTYLPPPS